VNKVREIAKKRLDEIAYAEARIRRKIDNNHPRSADLKKRLDEYEVSKYALNLELKSGTAVKIKDAGQMALISVLTDGDDIPMQVSRDILTILSRVRSPGNRDKNNVIKNVLVKILQSHAATNTSSLDFIIFSL